MLQVLLLSHGQLGLGRYFSRVPHREKEGNEAFCFFLDRLKNGEKRSKMALSLTLFAWNSTRGGPTSNEPDGVERGDPLHCSWCLESLPSSRRPASPWRLHQ